MGITMITKEDIYHLFFTQDSEGFVFPDNIVDLTFYSSEVDCTDLPGFNVVGSINELFIYKVEEASADVRLTEIV
jgi:hypothetical protein